VEEHGNLLQWAPTGRLPDRMSKMKKICDIAENIGPNVGKYCWEKKRFTQKK